VTPAAWRVELGSRARKDLRNLDPPVRLRMIGAIRRLALGEGALDVQPLRGTEAQRLRVGAWRVIFDRDVEAHVIVVLRVLPRGRAYDR